MTITGTGNTGTKTVSVSFSIVKADPTLHLMMLQNHLLILISICRLHPVALGFYIHYSRDTDVATVSGNTVSIVGAGTTTVTVSQAADINYKCYSYNDTPELKKLILAFWIRMPL